MGLEILRPCADCPEMTTIQRLEQELASALEVVRAAEAYADRSGPYVGEDLRHAVAVWRHRNYRPSEKAQRALTLMAGALAMTANPEVDRG